LINLGAEIRLVARAGFVLATRRFMPRQAYRALIKKQSRKQRLYNDL
jgi:hypothetical protein